MRSCEALYRPLRNDGRRSHSAPSRDGLVCSDYERREERTEREESGKIDLHERGGGEGEDPEEWGGDMPPPRSVGREAHGVETKKRFFFSIVTLSIT